MSEQNTQYELNRPAHLFEETDSMPKLDLRAGKMQVSMISVDGLGYHFAILNDGMVVIRSERSLRTLSLNVSELVTHAIKIGIDEVKP